MVLDWLAKGRPSTVAELLARKQFDRAVELAQAQVKERPRDARRRLQLADTLVAGGRGGEAVPLLREIADELAGDGFAAKAIAILKRIQKLSPGRSDVEERLAALIQSGTRGAAPRRAPAPAVPEIGMEEFGEEPEIELMAPSPAAPVVGTPLFPDFAPDELVAVMRGLELLSFSPGDVIVSAGEPGDSLFLLTTGAVKAWVRDPRQHYVLVRELKEGDFFGEISVLTGSPRTATVTAASHCELLELDRATLDGITATHPHVREVLESFSRLRAEATPGAVPAGV